MLETLDRYFFEEVVTLNKAVVACTLIVPAIFQTGKLTKVNQSGEDRQSNMFINRFNLKIFFICEQRAGVVMHRKTLNVVCEIMWLQVRLGIQLGWGA